MQGLDMMWLLLPAAKVEELVVWAKLSESFSEKVGCEIRLKILTSYTYYQVWWDVSDGSASNTRNNDQTVEDTQ